MCKFCNTISCVLHLFFDRFPLDLPDAPQKNFLKKIQKKFCGQRPPAFSFGDGSADSRFPPGTVSEASPTNAMHAAVRGFCNVSSPLINEQSIRRTLGIASAGSGVGSADSRFPPGSVSEAPPTNAIHAAKRGFCNVSSPNAKVLRRRLRYPIGR